MTETATRADELNILAACMNGHDPRNIDLIPADFDEPKHAATWAAMHDVLNAGREIDPATVHAAMGPSHVSEAPWLFEFVHPSRPARQCPGVRTPRPQGSRPPQHPRPRPRPHAARNRRRRRPHPNP